MTKPCAEHTFDECNQYYLCKGCPNETVHVEPVMVDIEHVKQYFIDVADPCCNATLAQYIKERCDEK